ncbi:conserved Plasmodium protein, unknown function [Babesia microti strain RI]|uniref:Uncharacterized protein n=1 Tax=Babesia microti (strain RI) TaxID=1133968 RepID=A0A1R4AAI6_BABMR|nr:conserved Plasmodium protein, unknown function [Babesia microti strain RI]SJK85997.1 conserved Plasmodium protein, unknown function [Babesia microti strain RI]|eukprot:XP_021338196.1 conserved Plasmodium protein, unknown function [Babesia microti strain RI]
MRPLPLCKKLHVSKISSVINVKYYTLTSTQFNPSKNALPVSKRVVELTPILSSTLKGKHLVALASTLCNNYKSFIAHKDADIVSRFWFIIIARLIDLINTSVEDCTVYLWKQRIPHNGSIYSNTSKQINLAEVTKLLKYFSIIRLMDQESPVSRLLNNAQWITHLLNSKLQNKMIPNIAPVNPVGNTPFFNRIFTPILSETSNAPNDETINSCNFTNAPSHLVKYEWILDQSFNFCMPIGYSDHITSVSDFITALKATLITNINDYIRSNCDTNCYAKLSMYIAMLSPSKPISPPYFNEIILKNLDQMKNQISEHICTNINSLKPQLFAFIANASGIGGNLTVLDCLEKYLIGEDGLPTGLAMSLHPDHLENICYAFSRRRVIKRGVFESLAIIVQYKFDDFNPIVTLNLLFSFSRVNNVDMVAKYLINKINTYTHEQLLRVSEKVLANAMQALASFYNHPEPYVKLAQVITAKRTKSTGFNNDKVIYSSVIKRLLERGVMNEPLGDCILYNQLIKLVNT